MQKYKYLLLLTLILITAALTSVAAYFVLTPDFCSVKEKKAAFVLSFDDKAIKTWHDHRPLFHKYNVKATFFITYPDSLTQEEKEMLSVLAADGHEVASHGYAHANAINYANNKSIRSYIEDEILPSINHLSKLGFHPVTFAYPYGAQNRVIDFELKKYFYLLRGDAWKVEGKGIDELDKIYYKYDGSKVVNGLGIDDNSNISVEELSKGFKRAKERKEAIIIYAHSISNTVAEYNITPIRLEQILHAAQKYHLKSLRFKDLVL